jgi:microcystin degradation protein MlrC
MPKILIAECKQEVSTFNPALSHYNDFDISTGQDVLSYHRNTKSEVAGALSVFAMRQDIELLPTFSARAITSGGALTANDFRRIASEFIENLKQAGEADGAFFAMHGAMAAEGEDDPEGYLLAEARKVLGEELPIVVSLDLHGVLTDRMLQHSNAVVPYHTYPHVDFFETGVRAGQLLLDILDGGAKPVTAKVAIPALVRGDELITETGRFGAVVREAKDLEKQPDFLIAGLFIGNPFTDVPDLQSYSVVISNGDPTKAEHEALRLAEHFWSERKHLQASLTSLDNALHYASNATGTVIFTDAADATSSGASGDSNAILKGLIEQNFTGTALVPIVDAPAVNAASAAGVGNTVEIPIGGSLDKRFQPVMIKAYVHMLSDGRFQSESHGIEWNAGPCAVLKTGGYTLVVMTRPVSLYDRSLFLAHGQDPKHYNIVVVKSPHCQPRFYAQWAERVINVDAPGSTSANLHSLGHKKCTRPIFPLDQEVTFQPHATVFQRQS